MNTEQVSLDTPSLEKFCISVYLYNEPEHQHEPGGSPDSSYFVFRAHAGNGTGGYAVKRSKKTRMRRILLKMILAGLVFLAGCVSAPPGEKPAFDRWSAISEKGYSTPNGLESASLERRKLPEQLPDAPVLQDYLNYAVTHHPAPQAAFHEWKASLERVPQARALMDPGLNYAYFVRESMTQQSVALTQMLPWYGKLKAGGDAAMEKALAAELRFEQARQQVLFKVKAAYAESVLLVRSLAVMRENRRILADVEAAARARFEAGNGLYADVVRAEVAVAQAEDRIRSFESRRDSVAGRMNAALGRQAHLSLPWPETLEIQPLLLVVDESRLLEWLVQHNPEIRAMGHDIAGRRHVVDVARQNRIPDVMLGVEYMDMVTMRDQVAVMGTINLPVWPGRVTAEREEALSGFSAASRRRVDRLQELEADLRLAIYRFQDAHRRVVLYEQTLIPMAHEALDAALAAYGAGEVGFQAVAETQTALQELQLTLERAAVDRFLGLAELERLVGRPLAGDDSHFVTIETP
jgi:outer membrane protein, heavy metal efflux system